MARTLTLENVAYHRNGICGEGFRVVNFHDSDNGPMMAVVFPYGKRDNCRIAVFNRDKLKEDEIGFGHNSWRGDHYETWLQAVIVVDSESFWSERLTTMKSPGEAVKWALKIGHAARIVLAEAS